VESSVQGISHVDDGKDEHEEDESDNAASSIIHDEAREGNLFYFSFVSITFKFVFNKINLFLFYFSQIVQCSW
jgi:hypothetical protein